MVGSNGHRPLVFKLVDKRIVIALCTVVLLVVGALLLIAPSARHVQALEKRLASKDQQSYSEQKHNRQNYQDPHHPRSGHRADNEYESHPHHNKHHHRVHRDILVIKPTFTTAAYRHGGFYDYYRGNCSVKCLKVKLNSRQPIDGMGYVGSQNALQVIQDLGIADEVSDQRVTKEPSILTNYHKIIVLHNEYVTKTEFDAITHHPNVLYLYPNALYALVTYNSSDATITLVRGHGYGGVNNGFGWGPSMSTKNEYDTSCDDWRMLKVANGFMLNCYPEFRVLHDRNLWKAIEN